MVERAEARGVRLAVENVRNTHILMAVLDSIDSVMLGLCDDAGHDFIWSNTPYEVLEKYGRRLFAVHLHDNMGQRYDHLPPGEGDINWDIIRTGIGKSSYKGSLTLESDTAQIPSSRMPQEHLKRHYEGAKSKLYRVEA